MLNWRYWPPMQASNHLSWNLNTETIIANQLRIVHHKEQMTVTAKARSHGLQKEIVYLTGDAVGQRRQVLNPKR